jgi:uncharacterized protein (UPF0332 family)
MTEKQNNLCEYRISQAMETIESSQLCLDNHFFKDSINRSYYAAFYGIKAILALSDIDFKRHKDVVAYFNQHYVATNVFQNMTGRLLARLQKKRETSDYDDFYIASYEEAKEQLEAAKNILDDVITYLKKQDIKLQDTKKSE